MIVYQETTAWPEGDNANHIYVLKAKPTGRTVEAVAYVPRGSDRVQKFRKPITLDLKGRTFRPVD
jgi:hypothetical protein